jgi:hypothetical protein
MFVSNFQPPFLAGPKPTIDILEHLARNDGGLPPSGVGVRQVLALGVLAVAFMTR